MNSYNRGRNRIVFGCFEVPGWGGLTTATYRLFEKMLRDGHDVHYLNLILEEEVSRFHAMLGPRCENPRKLPHVHSCYLRSPLKEAHPELTEQLDSLDPDRIVGVGDISSHVLKRASPTRELFFLTAGCMQVNTRVPFAEYWSEVDRASITDRREKEAVELADVILTHSPVIQDLYRHLYPDNAYRIHPDVFWFAEWIAEDAREFSGLSLPFEERDIDALFIASSWARPEKNAALVAEIVSRLPDHSVHIIGESAEQFGSATHHGFVGSRAETFQIMGRARTVVSPSFFDAAPGILFEGSAMGCNVVTSRNCGNWELCNEALLVNDYTADGFAAVIKLGREKKFADNMNKFVSPSSYRSLVGVLNGTSPAIPLAVRDAVAP